ncbi:hypothetical protein AAG570_007290 [Ranatra chinensis]|uniref:Uncharacterized protein n=1 Tax=Ranatra chinensis TaxID=642074 RepID=A0ABD0YH89_9HEMI
MTPSTPVLGTVQFIEDKWLGTNLMYQDTGGLVRGLQLLPPRVGTSNRRGGVVYAQDRCDTAQQRESNVPTGRTPESWRPFRWTVRTTLPYGSRRYRHPQERLKRRASMETSITAGSHRHTNDKPVLRHTYASSALSDLICTVISRSRSRLKMASQHRNTFYENKKQETMEI